MTKKTFQLIERLQALGFTSDESFALRRIEMTLHRWCELKCGDSNGHCSWAIERDEATGKPFRVVYPHQGNQVRRYPVQDREKGALARLQTIVQERIARLIIEETISGKPATEILPYYQTDCRGCALYLVKKSDIGPNDKIESCYTRGLAVCE